jgi:hypothetical protein
VLKELDLELGRQGLIPRSVETVADSFKHVEVNGNIGHVDHIVKVAGDIDLQEIIGAVE